MVPEAKLEQTGAGLAPTSEGWFVINARDAPWRVREGRGVSLAFTGSTDDEAETLFPQLGMNLFVLAPGEPISMYHWEADTEGFLMLSGEALLLVEGQQRPLRQWDFVHCPPQAAHTILGAGDGPCAILAIGSRVQMATEEWGAYPVDELALRQGVGVEEETNDPDRAYGRFPPPRVAPYQEGWLPGS